MIPLGGSLLPNLPPYPSSRPPVRASTQNQDPFEPPTSLPAALLTELQSQLHNSQTYLATHVNKVSALETAFAEHDAIKREVGVLRQLVEKSGAQEDGAAGGTSDDDDARSIRTFVPHELE
ncbi:hypothetical protein PILCRDRAFT_15719 [Piloderma croceum F 1598]|uniref:Uncharacterized protein n=1 Tax=Piloderma croceum (strain F 1598) TaxID=765440 RepID=A0A0C3EY71_PILCF|nr:hypothetical protein PILCRDRAFT_15719 [Piloderma croceum F 1598]